MFQLSPWTKVSLDQCLLRQNSFWTNVPWTKWSLDNCPLDKCINTRMSAHNDAQMGVLPSSMARAHRGNIVQVFVV